MEKKIYLKKDKGFLCFLDDSFDISNFNFLDEKKYKTALLLGYFKKSARTAFLSICLNRMKVNQKTILFYNIFDKNSTFIGFLCYAKVNFNFIERDLEKKYYKKLLEMGSAWELACAVKEDFMGQGFMFDALSITQNKLEENNVKNLLALTDSGNLRMKKLLLRLNFSIFCTYRRENMMREVWIKKL